jgi:hypothetical protein
MLRDIEGESQDDRLELSETMHQLAGGAMDGHFPMESRQAIRMCMYVVPAT